MNRDSRLPGNLADRKLSFGACSGKKMKDIPANQLSDSPAQGYVKFGKPQIAMMTINGNDLSFTKAINSCVLKASPIIGAIPSCDSILTAMEQKLDSQQFFGDLDKTFLDVVVKGRVNSGATPPESFQLFVNGYVPFWNEVDIGCDTVSWVVWGWRSPAYLTTQLRKRMNDIVRKLNLRIKESAERMRSHGVFYIDGFQEEYQRHQFCDPTADPNLKNPNSANTWFWHLSCPWNGGEGPRSTTDTSTSLPDLILTQFIPDPDDRAAVMNGTLDPAKVSDVDTDEKFDAVIDALAQSKEPDIQAAPIQWKRIFHPKGSAYSAHSRINVAAIVATRDGNAGAPSDSQPTCHAGTTVKASHLQACIDSLKAKGDNPTKNNCCGGGPTVCGSLLAQKGTASIALCGETKQCMGRGELAGLTQAVLTACVIDGSFGTANGTVDGKPGLEYEVRPGST